jgi:hypothetical protein
MMEEKEARDTVGSYATELMQKEPESRDPIELQREIHKNTYEGGVFEAIERGKKSYKSPFYVVVIVKKERLMQNVLRHYFFPRQTCPRPEWDQVVYRYTDHDEKIEFLWVIPDKQTCQLFMENAVTIAPEEKWLLKMVLDFKDGTLDNLSKTYNGELIA